MILENAATQGTRSSRTFQIRASALSGSRTRKIFACRLLIVEPMEGGRATDETGHVIGSGNELGTANQHFNCRKTIDRDACSHLLDRFYGQDVLAGQRQKLGELPRASAEIDDGVGRWEVGEQGLGIFGPSRDVLAHFARMACGNRRRHDQMLQEARAG